MLGFVTLGSNTLQESSQRYDQIMAMVGLERMVDMPGFKAWGKGLEQPFIALVNPNDGEQATAGNGTMVAVYGGDTANVDAMHAKALSLGFTNEGDPGIRPAGFYCAYVRDVDGNKFNFYCKP